MANTKEYIRLKELGNSKFEVAKNEYDIRGWTVKNSQGRILGKVNDLLFDKESEKVLYMVLDLEGNEMHLKDRKVIAPLSVAELNEAYRNVTFPGVMANELTELPTYEKGKASTRVEDIVQHAFANTGGNPPQQRSSASNLREDNNVSDNAGQYQPATDRSRPQTVVGVFEHSNQGQVAVEYLLDNNFRRNQIEVSSRATEYQEGSMNNEDHSVTNWFKSVFGNDDDARTYSEAAKTGCVITVHTSAYDEAQRAAEILDKHGALNIDDTSRGQSRSFKSRILDRKEANSKWGR